MPIKITLTRCTSCNNKMVLVALWVELGQVLVTAADKVKDAEWDAAVRVVELVGGTGLMVVSARHKYKSNRCWNHNLVA